MSKKVFQNIFIVVFFIIFSYFYWGDFLEYQQYKNNVLQEETLVQENADNFSVEDILNLEKVEVHSTPNKWLLDNLLDKIKLVEERLYIEVYILTESRIIDAIKKVNERGIDVKVILEKNPYMAPRLNDKAYNALLESWVDVIWSNPKSFSLNHSKLIILDDEIILSTWNLSYSTFAKNLDIFLFIKDNKLLSVIEKIFLWDFALETHFNYYSNLVLSPDYSRKKLEKLINSSKKSIKLYFPYIKDDLLENLIIEKAESWLFVSVLVSKDFYEENPEKINFLKESWIKVEFLNKYKMHSKAILLDDKYLFIWSINFSKYSLDKNREFGVLLKESEIIKEFLNIWK